MTDIFQDLDALSAEMAAVQKDFQKKGEAKLRDAFKAFLGAFPQVRSLTVVGLVPYFNDGEPCEFYIRDVFLTGSDREADWSEWQTDLDDAEYETCIYDDDWIGDIPEEIETVRRHLSRILSSLEDVLQAVFGSHFIVTVTRQGLTVEAYEDHD
jgi:hypothetical protein